MSNREFIRRRILPFVRKPQRYAGGEIHSVCKAPGSVAATIALAFPDLYEIGASNLGLALLYHTINRDPRFAAERVYMVESDMAERMAKTGFPLFALESSRPLKEFDCIGFTLQYELGHVNLVAMLRLAGIPLRRTERGENDPLILGGGPLSVNPLPLAGILDAVVIGDGEEIVLRCLEILSEKRARADTLERLAALPGLYVPGLTKSVVHPSRIDALTRVLTPTDQLVPLFRPIHDRYAVEVMRGCPHGCRFCSAGFYYRPLRERAGSETLELIRHAVEAEGWRDVSLLSLSTADYSALPGVLSEGVPLAKKREVSLSLPSTRVDKATASLFSRMDLSKRVSLTLAPEAGSERLRRVINKPFTDDELLANVSTALQSGFDVVKLYFMVGLPTENDEDLAGIALLTDRIGALFGRHPGRRKLNISVSLFSPKPGTPFEGVPVPPLAELERRLRYVRDRIHCRFAKISLGDPRAALLETVLARGGEEMSEVILAAETRGLLLQGWNEYFDFPGWLQLFESLGFDLEREAGRFMPSMVLPWHTLMEPERIAFLASDYQRALAEKGTDSCTEGCPEPCGACGNTVSVRISPPLTERSMIEENGRRPERSLFRHRSLFTYEKGEAARFIPLKDMMRLFERVFRVARVPILYSEGFSPHPRIGFFCALPLGLTGSQELLTTDMEHPFETGSLAALNKTLPDGLRLLSEQPMLGKGLSEKEVEAADYSMNLEVSAEGKRRLDDFMKASVFPMETRKEGIVKTVDIRPLVLGVAYQEGCFSLRLKTGLIGNLKALDFLRAVLLLPEEEVLSIIVNRERLIFK